MTAEHDPVILDACCVMTLYGSERMGDVLATLPTPVFVCDYVLEEEALTVYDGPPGNVRVESTEIDLRPFEQEGLVDRTSLRSEEQATFVRLAKDLDDGEARTIAIALHRDWAVGTDDKKALRMCQSEAIETVTTPTFVRGWVEEEDPPHDEVTTALRRIRTRAVYLPSTSHPEYEWWAQYSGE